MTKPVGPAARILLAAVLCTLALAGGCDLASGKPVQGVGNTVPARSSAAAQPTPSALAETPEPTATPEPGTEPAAPAPWSFPMRAAALFGVQGAPREFTYPLHLMNNGRDCLYASGDGRVMRAAWNGTVYQTVPIAEKIGTTAPENGYVDEQRGMLLGCGERFVSQGRVDPVIVVVDLATSGRCELDMLLKWREKDALLSQEYQYQNGFVLSRLNQYKNGEYVALGKWAIADMERATYSILDLSGFVQMHLSQWERVESPRLALLGENRLLAVYTVSGARQPDLPETGGQQAGCLAFVLDGGGKMLHSLGFVAGGVADGQAAIGRGVAFAASQDGKYLIYSGSGMQGLYLYDVEQNREHPLTDGKALRTFAQWGSGRSFYYGSTSGGIVTIAEADAASLIPPAAGTGD